MYPRGAGTDNFTANPKRTDYQHSVERQKLPHMQDQCWKLFKGSLFHMVGS